ncbi:MAG: hypothetical protein R3C97_15145 [Geminicoccaceae bacterium]
MTCVPMVENLEPAVEGVAFTAGGRKPDHAAALLEELAQKAPHGFLREAAATLGRGGPDGDHFGHTIMNAA